MKYINPHTDFDRDIVNAIRTAEKKKYAEGRTEGDQEFLRNLHTSCA